MTTIAYKDGVIAYDSRMTCGGIVVDDEYEKAFHRGSASIFYCGEVGDTEEFLGCVFDGKKPSRNLDCEAFVLHGERLYCVDVSEELIRKVPLRLDNHYAIGSGTKFAIAYMDCGMTALEAVKKTATRDIYSGGTIKFIFTS